MQSLDEMSVNEAIALYYEKYSAMQQRDTAKLLELKKRCPEIFVEEKYLQIRDMINYIGEFQNSARYKELQRLEMKKKFFATND